MGGSGWSNGLGGLPTLVALCAVPFCSQHLRHGNWVLAFLYLIVHINPLATHYVGYFWFLCVLLLEKMFIQVQVLK